MRVVYLNPSGQLGGAEKVLLNIFASLNAARPDWTLHLITSAPGPLNHRASGLGVSVRVLQFPRSLARLGDAGAGGPAGNHTGRARLALQLLASAPLLMRYAVRLRATLKELQPDLVHTNGFKMHILGALACPKRTPLIWHLHDYVSSRPLMARMLRLCARRCSLAITNSHSVGEDLRMVCGKRPRIQTVHNGIDLEDYSPKGPRLNLDQLSGLPPANGKTVRVGLVGTFARWKGHETFLRALASLHEDLPVRGYIIGDAVYETDNSQHSLLELRRIAVNLNLGTRIGFTGLVEDSAAAMRALDIVVHASTQPEPFGLVIAEGMACGRAVIASQSGGAAELFLSGVDAFSHTSGDADMLAERITELAAQPELRASLGAAARATSEQRFDRSRLAVEMISLYKSLMPSVVQSQSVLL